FCESNTNKLDQENIHTLIQYDSALSELYNNILDNNKSDELSNTINYLELTSGLTFHTWKEFKTWIHNFVLKKGLITKSDQVKQLKK
ncbi:29461_t:CDS:2, partial [Racocetra persica]